MEEIRLEEGKKSSGPRKSLRKKKPTVKRSSWLYEEDFRKKSVPSQKERKPCSKEFPNKKGNKTRLNVEDKTNITHENMQTIKRPQSRLDDHSVNHTLEKEEKSHEQSEFSTKDDINHDQVLPLKKRKYALSAHEENLSQKELSNMVNMDHSYHVLPEVDTISDSGTVSDIEDTDYTNLVNPNINNELDKETIGEILGIEIPEETFEFELPRRTSFLLDRRIWADLFKRRKGKCLPAGEWQSLFVDGIKQSNQFCVFNFKRHSVSEGKRPGNIFQAFGQCKFQGCPVNVKLRMTVLPVVDAKYTGHVKHIITEKQARYIRKGERQTMKKVFEDGKMPSKHMKQSIHVKDTKSLIAGNYDGIGKTASVLQKIASESHQTGRMDSNVVESLQKMKHNIDGQRQQTSVIPGFIQDIGLDPTFIHFWNKDCIILWNKLCSNNVAYLDATGSVTRKSERGARMLYYEMAMAHPKKPNMSLPVAMMVSEKQSEPYVSHFLRQFRHGEKSLKGHSGLKQPMQINTDWSWVMINSVLNIFNHDTLQEYLSRCWKILSGQGNEDDFLSKTILHVCLSHHMKLVKHKCQTFNKPMMYFGMYFMSLLTRCQTLEEARNLLFHGLVVLRTKHFSDELKPHVRTILKRINSLKTDVPEKELYIFDEMESSSIERPVEDGQQFNVTEEEFLQEAPQSPFKNWFQGIVIDAEKVINAIDVKSANFNKYYCPNYSEKVLLHYLPTFPLWSNILLPHNRKLKQIYQEKGLDVNNIPIFAHSKPAAKTQGIIEQRFKVLKSVERCGNKYIRLDDFANNLQIHCESTIKAAVLECLKETPRKRKATKKNEGIKREEHAETSIPHVVPKKTILINEEWGEKVVSRDNTGVFQSPPKKVFRTADCFTKKRNPNATTIGTHHHVKENYTGISNLGTTCWFGAFLQAIAKTAMGDVLITMKEYFKPLIQDSQLFTNLLDKVRKGEDVSQSQLTTILYGNPNLWSPNSISGLFDAGEQQDVTEFYFLYFNKYLEEIGPFVDFQEVTRCNNCQKETVELKKERISHLQLDIPQNAAVKLPIQTLIDNTSSPEMIQKECECGPLRNHIRHVYYMSAALPSLCLILKRFMMAGNKLKKNQNDVNIDMNIVFCGKTYTLKSIVVHKGRSLNIGHYYSIVTSKEGNQTFTTLCDDKTIRTTPFNGLWDMEVKRNCLLLVYDLVDARKTSDGNRILAGESVLSCMNMLSFTRQAHIFWSNENDLIAEDVQGQVDFIRSMQDMSVLHSLKLRIMKNPMDVLEHFITGICQNNGSTNLYVYQLVHLQLLHGFKCAQCKYQVSEATDAPTVVPVNDVSEEGIKAAVQAQLVSTAMDTVCQPCGCLKEEDRAITIVNFPSSLFISHHKPENVRVNNLPFQLILNDILIECHTEYQLSCILVHGSNSDCIALKVSHKGIFEYLNMYAGKQCSTAVLQSLVSDSQALYLFYNKKVGRNEMAITARPCTDESWTQEVAYANSTIKITSTKNAKTTLSIDSWNRIKSLKKWYNSDIIDAYMQLLSHSSDNLNIVCLPSGWLNQKLFFESDPKNPKMFFPATLHERSNWFDFDFVVAPVNVRNRHWVLYCIDMKQKEIYFCNSQKDVYLNFDQALMKTLAVEFWRKHLQRMKTESFTIVNFNQQHGFPFQTDNFNCGPYICIMAKCIIFSKKFVMHKSIRETIAHELYYNKLLL